jgi:hypothetical protein
MSELLGGYDPRVPVHPHVAKYTMYTDLVVPTMYVLLCTRVMMYVLVCTQMGAMIRDEENMLIVIAKLFGYGCHDL